MKKNHFMQDNATSHTVKILCMDISVNNQQANSTSKDTPQTAIRNTTKLINLKPQ
jgi:hypothetical protein